MTDPNNASNQTTNKSSNKTSEEHDFFDDFELSEVIERPKRVIKRWVKWVIGLVLVIPVSLLLLFLILGILTFTQIGLSSVIWTSEKLVSGLVIEQAKGALLPSFSLSNVQYKTEDGLDLDIESVSYDMTLDCLFDFSLCVDSLSLRNVNLVVPENNSPVTQNADEPSLTLVSFPFPMSLKNLQAKDVSLDIMGNKISWDSFSSSINLFGNTVTLEPTAWQGIQLTLAESKSSPPSSRSSRMPKLELQDIDLPWHFEIEQFEVRDFVLTGDSSQKIDYLLLKGKSENNDIEIEQFTINTPQADASLNGKIKLSDNYPLSFSLYSNLKLQDFKGQMIQADVSGNLADLALSLQLDYGLQALVKGKINLLQDNYPFDLALTKGQLAWPLTGTPEYQAQIDLLDANGSFAAYQVDLKGKVEGRNVPASSLDLQGKGSLESFTIEQMKLDTLGGQITGNAMVDWQAPLNWNATLKLNKIQPEKQWPDWKGSISGDVENSGSLSNSGGWNIEFPKLDINGRLRGQAIKGKGEITLGQDPKGNISANSSGFILEHGQNKVSIKGALAETWDMTAQLDLANLVQTVPQLKGRVKGNLVFTGPKDHPSIKVALDANNLSSTQWDINLNKLAVKGDVSPYPTVSGSLNFDLNKGRYQNIDMSSLSLALSGEQAAHQLNVKGVVNDINIGLKLNGGIDPKSPQLWQGKLDDTALSWNRIVWKPQAPVGLSYQINKQQFTVQTHCWINSPSKVCLNKPFQTGQTSDIDVGISDFRLARLKQFLPAGASLRGDLNAEIKGVLKNASPPQITIDAKVSSGNYTQKRQSTVVLGWDQLSVNADLKNNQLNANWQFDLTNNGQIKGDAILTNIDKENPTIQANNNVKDVDLSFLSPFIGTKAQLDADLNSNLKLSGAMLRPQVFGDINLTPLQASGELLPITVESGHLTAKFNGYNATLSSELHTPDGQLDITGNGDWSKAKAWFANLNVKGERLDVEAPPMVRLQVSPDLKLSVTPELAKISGEINIPWGRILVETLPENAIRVSSDEVLLDQNLMPIKQSTGLPMRLETDVDLNIGDDVSLSAFGLKAGLTGSLHITQENDAPYVLGEVNVVNGTYKSFGQDLLIQEGKIIMNGPVDQPYLSIKAIRNPDTTEDNVLAGLMVTGPADDPQVTVFSEPSLEQTNALSYLLRGRSIDSDSDSSAMTTALIGLSLARTGRVVTDIGNTFGVQDLQLGTAGSGDDSQVTVSGYIAPDLQVKYGIGIFDSVGEFTVRYKLFTDFYVEAMTGLDSAVDFIYQFSF